MRDHRKPAGVTRRTWSSRWRVIVLFGVQLAACKGPAPVHPPAIPPPPSAEQQRFTAALFSIYHRARIAVGDAAETKGLVMLKEAAAIVTEDAATFGDVWRVLAITQLAAADIRNVGFRSAINTLGKNPQAAPILGRALAAHPRAELREREQIVYEFLLGPKTFLELSPTSQPDCPSTYPTVDTTHAFGVATATMTVWVQKPLDHLAKNMDPQSWDNPCGALLFNAAYLTDLKSDGTFDVDANFDAAPGTPQSLGQTWGQAPQPRYLFEHFLPGAGSNFFKNILDVETERKPDSFAIKYYDLEASLQTQIAPDSALEGGLLDDSGTASVSTASAPWLLVQGSKTVRFDNVFDHHTPDQIADDAETSLKIMGTGFAYWVCCPR
jgi:hypothetical protein